MARSHAGPQAADAGDRGAGQLERAHCLGTADEGWSLSSSARYRISGAGARPSGV
jgi:hypothetical protein